MENEKPWLIDLMILPLETGRMLTDPFLLS